MTLRRIASVLALALLVSSGTARAATFETTNFSVEAPDPALAKKFGETAEFYRREKALEWLGHEMPNWPQKCPIQVTVNMGGAGGATNFTFGVDGSGRGVVTRQWMEIRGDVKQLLHSVLPHEVTHTVLAHHFGRPVPRWADEGGSVLSENDEERFQHDVRCRELLNAGRGIRLRVLFRMAEYPRDMIVLYAQGYSITAFLVEKGGGGREGRARLLQFLAYGMQGSTRDAHGTPETWNEAARRVYQIESVDQLEATWLEHLRTPGPRTSARTTGNAVPGSPAGTVPGYAANDRTDVRSSAAPAIPVLEPPVKSVRGSTPDAEPYRPAAVPVVAPAAKPLAPELPPPSVLLPPEIPRRN
ncbi:MAG: hypothetical protein K2P78_02310 [Gemmataceae bacterium]|nr:hypothetical protein [Gemmataceae bacterium]